MSQSDTAKAPLKYKLLLPVFFVVDVSGSIDNIGFSNINKIMRESIALLKERAQKFSDAEFEVAILVYSDDAHFITDGLVKLDCFVWKNISDGGILSELGKALKLLDSKLSKRAFM